MSVLEALDRALGPREQDVAEPERLLLRAHDRVEPGAIDHRLVDLHPEMRLIAFGEQPPAYATCLVKLFEQVFDEAARLSCAGRLDAVIDEIA